MSSATLKPLLNEPALLLKSKSSNILCIADVHVGYEAALGQAGFRVPSQTEKLVEKVYELTKRINAKKLIIVGDVKHEMASSKFSLQECASFLTQISSFVEIEIIKGNHDVGIEKTLPKNVVLHSSRGVLIPECNVALIHGHAWPKIELLQAEQIIMAHNHPVIELKNGSGARWLKPVWMEAQLDKTKIASHFAGKEACFNGLISMLVMPAFNPLLGGIPVNVDTELLGPLLSRKIITPDDISLTLLDATYVGKLSHLKRSF